MRTFTTGATRSNIEGKLSYMRALSPAVLRRYVTYLAKHRKQADGQIRAFDNWKNGIPQDTYLDGLLRHTWDAWLIYQGHKPSDESYDLPDLLCAIIFNASGWLFELQVAEGGNRENPTIPVEPEKSRTCGECIYSNGTWTCHKGRPNATSDILVVTCPDFTLPKVLAKPRTCEECRRYGNMCGGVPDMPAGSCFAPKVPA